MIVYKKENEVGLPIYKPTNYTTKLPVSGKSVKFRPYTIEEEKALLTIKESTDLSQEDKLKAFFDLTEKCVIGDNIKIAEMAVSDFVVLSSKIRMKSVTEVLNMSIQCPSCKKHFEYSTEISNIIKIENEGNKKVLMEIDDTLKLNLTTPTVDILFELSKVKKEIDILDTYITYCIESVVFNKEVYSNFTKQELFENIVSNFPQKMIYKVYEEIKKLVSVDFVLENCKCFHCGHTFTTSDGNMINFLI